MTNIDVPGAISSLPNVWKVYFGSAFSVDGFGFVGHGTLTINENSIMFEGKKSWSTGAKLGIFLAITVVPILLFGVGLGIIPAFIVVYYFCASKGRSLIDRGSIFDIRRRGRTVSFKGINPDTGKQARAIFLARTVEQAETLELQLPSAPQTPIG